MWVGQRGWRALDSPLGSTSPASIGVAMVTLGFIPLVAFAVTRRFARFITPRA